VHGLFGSDAFREVWLASFNSFAVGSMSEQNPLAYDTLIEQTLDELAAHLAQHIDMDMLLKIAR
jgi:adenosylcobyric acid synthase